MPNASTKSRAKNLWSKTRKLDNPYMIISVAVGWEHRVLKAYQTRAGEITNYNSRWLCAVKSPYTYGSYEYGDVYIHELAHFFTPEDTALLHDRKLEEESNV